MLSPKKTKYRKSQKLHGISPVSNTIKLYSGKYGLKVLENGLITAKTIEAVRRTFIRTMKRRGQLWIKVFPDIPITQKASQSRMGKGKGGVSHWVSIIKPGQILFEVNGISYPLALQAVLLASNKLGFRCQLVSNHLD